MPDSRLIAWRRLIQERSNAAGRVLSADVIDELVSHLADVYDGERADGRSESHAMIVVRRLIESGAYGDVAATGRARATRSRLLDRARRQLDRVWMDAAFDVRYAVRSMRRQIVFSILLVAILAVGIGATTAAYAVIESVLLRALPYPAAEQLVVLKHGRPPDESSAFSPADWLDYAARHESLRGLAAYSSWPMNLTGGGEPERLRSVIVSGEFFNVAGVAAALGRTSGIRDDSPAAPAVVVLADGFWRRRFAANHSVVGTAIVLNGRVATVIGVMPPGFALPYENADLWMPMGLSPQALSDRTGEWLSLVGRLRPGVKVHAAQADLALTAAHLAAAFPRTNRDARLTLYSLGDVIVGGSRRALWLGALAALFVLFAGTANAANLMLARATVRQDEIAIRAALGADPLRLARQLLVESSVFAVLGGAVGAGLSWTFLRGFELLADSLVPRATNLTIHGNTLAIAFAASLLSAVVIGGTVAWLLVRSGAQAGFRTGPQRIIRPAAMQSTLLAAQVAFAMMLIAGASLVARSYVATLHGDPGFDTSDTMTMQLTLPKARYADDAAQVRFAERAIESLGALPGVTAAGVVSDLPFVGNATHFPVAKEGEPADAARMTTVRLADPGFFRVLRVPLIAGRYFDMRDRRDGDAVAILNHSAAMRYGEQAALGRRLQIAGQPGHTVVGIVADIKHAGLHAEEGPVMYVPYAQKAFDFLNWIGVVVRVPGAPPSAMALKAAVARVDPDQPVEAVQSMADYVAHETAPYQFGSLVVGSLSGAALLLALSGIYGLTTFIVGRRARELALRLALGASGASVVMTVFRQIAVVLMIGAAAGVVGTLITNRLLIAALAEPAPGARDLSTAVIAWAIIAVCATIAALAPAMRGARLDPKIALQGE